MSQPAGGAPSRGGEAWVVDAPFPAAGRMRVYDLAQPLYTGIPHHPNHPPYAFTLTKRHGEVMYPDGVSAASELITTGGHVGTHVDGLAHVSRGGRVFGGHDVGEAQSYGEGVRVNPVHELPPIACRAHLVDAPSLLGRALEPADGIGAAEFERWFADRETPGAGDAVLVRTGWDDRWDDPSAFLGVTTGAPGVTLDGARWLTGRGVRATGCDTVAYEQMPNPALQVHVHLLVDSGVPIMEAMRLRPLVDAGVWTFFFVAVPLAIRGGTGSPIRPLAFVPADRGDPDGAPEGSGRER